MTDKDFELEVEGEKEHNEFEHAGFDANLNFEKILWIQLHRVSKALSNADPNTWNCVNTLADLLLIYQDEQYGKEIKEFDDEFNKNVTAINSSNILKNEKDIKTKNQRLNLAGKKFKSIMQLLGRQQLLLKGKIKEKL